MRLRMLHFFLKWRVVGGLPNEKEEGGEVGYKKCHCIFTFTANHKKMTDPGFSPRQGKAS